MLVYTYVAEKNVQVKGKMKNYTNVKRHTKLSTLCQGNDFLNRRMKQQKLFPLYTPQNFTVIKEWQDGDSTERRLSSHPDTPKDPIPMLIYTHIVENDVREKGKMKNYAKDSQSSNSSALGMNS